MAKMKDLINLLDDVPGVELPENYGNAYKEGVRHPSPSFNAIFGNTQCLPLGASACFWGPFKGGKSFSLNAMIGQLHQDDSDAVALKFDTEMREKFQMTPMIMKMHGIDPKRYRAISTNKPNEIFDFIENKIPALKEKGLNIKLVGIDSINEILGRRMINATTVDTQQIGDEAATIKDGLKRIRATLRRHNIALVMIAQERDELDPVQIMRGKKKKMAGANSLKHFAEYFVRIFPNEAKDGKTDLLGNKLTNSNDEPFAHKIKAFMQDSSVGPKRRIGEFTFDYGKGIVNKHEELFELVTKYNLVERPNNRTYTVKAFQQKIKKVVGAAKKTF